MNILPVIFAFLILFSIGSYAWMKDASSSFQEKEHFLAKTNISLTLFTESQKAFHGNISQKQEPKKSQVNESDKETLFQHKTSKKKEPFESRRLDFYPSEHAKLNIKDLRSKEKPDPRLVKIFYDLIDLLYGKTVLCNSGKSSSKPIADFLLELLQKAKGINAIEKLSDFAPEDKKQLIYSLLKGTQSYTMETNQGYPPLGDFVRITPRQLAIYPSHAHIYLLKVLYSEEVIKQVIEQEKKLFEQNGKYTCIQKSDFNSIIQNENFDIFTYDDLVRFISTPDPKIEQPKADAIVKIRS